MTRTRLMLATWTAAGLLGALLGHHTQRRHNP